MTIKFARRIGRHFAGAVVTAMLLALPAGAAAAKGLDLSAYKGKVVYLDFWASWCNPCRQSFPWMNTVREMYAGKDFVIVAVNVDHDRELAQEFLQDNPADFKIVYDPDGDIAEQFSFRDMPTSYLIDRDGKVRYVHRGFYPSKENEYLAQIEQLVGSGTR